MKIHLGTAQFGLEYGITNKSGKVSLEEVKRIMSLCESLGIEDIDTAHDYGTAEEILGEVTYGKEYKLTTKLTLGTSSGTGDDLIKQWDAKLKESLRRLRRSKIHTLLVHDAKFFQTEEGKTAEKWLHSVKERGLAEETGTSLYSPDEIRYIPDVGKQCIQVPVSIYSQSAVKDDLILGLIQEGATVIARSIFLQGLLLKPAEQWPSWMPDDLTLKHQQLEEFCTANNMTFLDACLQFIGSINCLKGITIGVCSRNELEQIYKSLPKTQAYTNQYECWDASESPYTDPRCWSKHIVKK
jgi:aryl-alcohol dehydrogenase-like predicted oxidoreductase